ncbi:hypothetical protein J2Y70_004343 [Xanthomonas translucens]|nr:hypothetical protein [Xanthomonas translucens]
MRSGHKCSRVPCTLLERVTVNDASTALDTDYDALLERHA